MFLFLLSPSLDLLLLLRLLFAPPKYTHALHFALVPKTTDNPFFQSAWHGCVDAAALLPLDESDVNVTCHYGGIKASSTNPNPDPTGTKQVAYIRSLLDQDNPRYDGLAISAKNPDLLRPIIQEAVIQRGIPVVTFDSDVQDSARFAYIGTDNIFMGETLAKVVNQIIPQGGIFAVLWGDDSPNVVARDEGLRAVMDPELWTELPGSPYNYQRDLSRALTAMEMLAQQNVTVIVTTVGGPLFHANYSDFFKRHRHRNITMVAADDFTVQIEHLSRGYVQGLVGQMPYEMGFQSARILYSLQATRPNLTNPRDERIVGTNLITHIQVPLILPDLNVDHNVIHKLRIIGYILLGAIVSTAAACIVWAITRRKHAVVRAAQPVFLMLVALGVALLGSMIVPLSMDDDGDPMSISSTQATRICMSVPWLGCCGFTTTFSALFSKTLRITRIFAEAQRCHRVRVTAVDVLVPFLFLLVSNVVVLVLWSVLDPLEYTRVNNPGTDGWNRVLSTFGACRCNNPLAYAIPLAVINLGVLVLAIWQAYLSRHIRLEFAESKYIFICMVSLLEALVIGIPILMVVRDSPQAFYLTMVVTVFCICMGVLLLIFVPKMRISAQYSQLSLVEQNRKIMEGVRESAGPPVNAPSLTVSGNSGPNAFGLTLGPSTPLTRPEIDFLSERIKSLQPEEMNGVAQIIRHTASPPIDPDADEIDVNIEQLSFKTQRMLLGYVSELATNEQVENTGS